MILKFHWLSVGSLIFITPMKVDKNGESVLEMCTKPWMSIGFWRFDHCQKNQCLYSLNGTCVMTGYVWDVKISDKPSP